MSCVSQTTGTPPVPLWIRNSCPGHYAARLHTGGACSCPTTGLGLNRADSGFRSVPLGDPSPCGAGVDANFRCGVGSSARTPASLCSAGWSSIGPLLLSGHKGGEAGCLSWTRVSQASATISRVMVPPADDDEATARSRMGCMASATLRRPISCSSVAAASRPSLVLGDSSELPMTTISRPGVWGSDVTGDATGPTSVILPPGTAGLNSCCSWPWGTTTTDRSDCIGSRSSSLS